MNAGSFYVTCKVDLNKEGIALAREAIASGAAFEKLYYCYEYQKMSQEFLPKILKGKEKCEVA